MYVTEQKHVWRILDQQSQCFTATWITYALCADTRTYRHREGILTYRHREWVLTRHRDWILIWVLTYRKREWILTYRHREWVLTYRYGVFSLHNGDGLTCSGIGSIFIHLYIITVACKCWSSDNSSSPNFQFYLDKISYNEAWETKFKNSCG